MPLESLIRSRGGTAERTVRIVDIAVPEVPEIEKFSFRQHWLPSAKDLRVELARLVDELKAGRNPSRDLFIPNYWGHLSGIPWMYRDTLEDLWHLAHDLGKATMTVNPNQWRETRSGVWGMTYRVRPHETDEAASSPA